MSPATARILLLLVLMPALIARGQERHWVFFADKGPEAAWRQAPEDYAPRALERRRRAGVAWDRHDRPVYPAYVDALEALPGVRVRTVSRWLNAASVETADPSALALMPAVRAVRPVARYRVDEAPVAAPPSPPPALRQRPRRAESAPAPLAYGPAANQVALMGVDVLHDLGYRGQGVLVGIFDGGFRGVDVQPAFAHLWAEDRVADYWNFHLDNDSVFRDSSHGTAVLSCIASRLDDGAYAGTAPEADVALYLTEVVGFERIIEEDHWVAAAERADAIGVDVINTSLGYTTFDQVDSAFNHSYADMDGNTTVISRAADLAASRGILVVVSAGNQGASNWRYISAPADGDSVLAVGATNQRGDYAFFSSYGPSADGDVKPNVAAVGWGTVLLNAIGEVTTGNGTSFSAPLVAGAAASLWSARPEAGNMALFDAIQRSGHLWGRPNDSLGHGIPDFVTAYRLLGETPSAEGPDGLQAWPVPVHGDRVWVWKDEAWAEGQPLELEAWDARGRRLARRTWTDPGPGARALELPGWSAREPGSYLLTLRQGDRVAAVKIVKPAREAGVLR